MNLKQHIHRKRIQVFCLNSIKEDLKSTNFLPHVDFSESYKNANQDEIQIALTSDNLRFLFLQNVHIHAQIRTIPITVTTEANEHSRVTTLSCIHKTISYIEEKVGAFTKLHIWSDGCTSQFRLRFVFSFLNHFHIEKEIERNFNEANHDKGPMDGVGGTIKKKSLEK